MKYKISLILLVSMIFSCTPSTENKVKPNVEDISNHCFKRFLGHNGIEDLSDSMAFKTDNGGYIIYEVLDSIQYVKKYKTSLKGCVVPIDTCFCSGKGKKCLDLIWENDSVSLFSYSAGSGVSADFIINKLDCDKSVFGYTLNPNQRGEYMIINYEDTTFYDIW